MKNELSEAVENLKNYMVGRNMCYRSGRMTRESKQRINENFGYNVDWVEFWDYNRIWVPCFQERCTKVSLYKDKYTWLYVAYKDLSKVQFENLCIAYDIDYNNFLEAEKPVILEDEDTFVI